MIKPFQYYLQEKLVRKSSSNVSMGKSLIEKAELRLKKVGREKIEEEEASISFEETYEVLREALQSLMEIKGFKPYSHEAIISFVKEYNLLSSEKINIVDSYRILRNNSVYKAEKVSLEKCEEALNFAKLTLPEIRKVFERLIKER